MKERLAGEMMDAANNLGSAVQEAGGYPQDGRVQQGIRTLSAGNLEEQRRMAQESYSGKLPETSASWPTSTPAKPPPPSVSCITPASTTRSVRPTTAPPPWTGWPRSRSGASPSPPPPPPATGPAPPASSPRPGSTSSTPRATWTSPWRWSVPCGCWTALSPSCAPRAAWSPSLRQCGARPTTIRSPA